MARTAIQEVLSVTTQVARARATVITQEEIPELYAVLTVVWVLDHAQCDRFEDLYEKAMTFLLAGDHPTPTEIDLAGPPSAEEPVWPPAELGDEPERAEEPDGAESFDTLVRPELLVDRLRDEIEDAESRAVHNGTASRRLVVRLSPGDFESYAERQDLVTRAIVEELGKLPVYAGAPPAVDLEPFSELGRGEFEFAFEPAAEAPAPELVNPPRPAERPQPIPPMESPWAPPPGPPPPEPEPAEAAPEADIDVEPEAEPSPPAPRSPVPPPIFDRGLFAGRPEQRPPGH